jgi:hypothetical protein
MASMKAYTCRTNLAYLTNPDANFMSLVLQCQGVSLACFIAHNTAFTTHQSGSSSIPQVPLSSSANFNMDDGQDYHNMLIMHAAQADTDRLQNTLDTSNAASANMRDCSVCMKDQPVDAFPALNADHHHHDPGVCRKCFNRYIVGHINAGHARIICVECSERLRYADVKEIVSKTSIKKYDKVLTKAFVEDDVDFHYCVSTSRTCMT